MTSGDWRGTTFSDQQSDSSLASYTAGVSSGGTSNQVTVVSSPVESVTLHGNNRPIGTTVLVDGPTESNYGSILKGHHSSKSSDSSHNLGGTNKGVQEESKNESSVLVHLSAKSNASVGPVVKQSTNTSTLRVKCKKCCTITMCCWSLLLLFMMVVTWLGFILIEVFPSTTLKKSVVFRDSIVLLARVDPFWYSLVTISEEKGEQDHMLHTYVVECDNIVVDNNILRYNRTLVIDQNVVLLDPTFMIDGTALDFTIFILNSSDSGGLLSSVIISGNADSQDIFKQNQTMRNVDITYSHNISKITDSFSFTTSKTGYYYIGFKPAGKMQIRVKYDVLGYKYVEPTNQESSCSTEKSGASCSVCLPTTLTNLNSDYYCVLCKVESSPFYVNEYSVSVDLKVHRGWWNMFTIAIFIVCSSATLCGWMVSIRYFVVSLKRRHHRLRASYTSIQ